jgi:ectoine hydroxylase-related dioxygenase (phytanoyl-CoA dioxygenase family)
VPLHQDWSLVDEDKYRSATVWLPLCDSVVANGAIHAIDGSHEMKAYPRGGTIHGKYEHLHEELKGMMKPYECEAGTIMLFDSRVLHYSPPNLSKKYRISVINNNCTQAGIYHPVL